MPQHKSLGPILAANDGALAILRLYKEDWYMIFSTGQTVGLDDVGVAERLARLLGQPERAIVGALGVAPISDAGPDIDWVLYPVAEGSLSKAQGEWCVRVHGPTGDEALERLIEIARQEGEEAA